MADDELAQDDDLVDPVLWERLVTFLTLCPRDLGQDPDDLPLP